MRGKGNSRARGQAVIPRTSRRVDRLRRRSRSVDLKRLLAAAARFAKPGAVVAGLLLAVIGYNSLAGSRLFALEKVEVLGASDSLKPEVREAVARAVGQRGLLDLDLAALKEKVEAVPRVRTARVARVLPDKILVHVEERQPLVPVRRDSASIVWLDADGVELGEITGSKTAERDVPPVAKGFSEDAHSPVDQATNRERIEIYKQLMRELSEGSEPKWSLLDQIDLEHTPEVSLQLARPPVMIRVGSRDFRNRFETALKILDAIKRGDSEMLRRYKLDDPIRVIENAGRIHFIDAARPDRIVINFYAPGAEKPNQPPRKKRTGG